MFKRNKTVFHTIPALLVFAATALAWSEAAQAGNDIYFVTYNHHIEKGEAEVMVMTDFTEPAERDDETGFYMSSMLEYEYGLTDQWATEFMTEGFFDLTHGVGRFTGFRWENRYRIHKDENRGLNPVLYMEYEDLDPKTRFKMEVSGREDGKGEPFGGEEKRERIMETRLLLSKDSGPWNIAFNWINETDTQRNGFTDFGYAFGVRRNLATHHHSEESEMAASEGLNESNAPQYRCPMHPDRAADKPGRCPVCGMEMEIAGNSRPSNAGRDEDETEERESPWKPVAIGLELYGGLGNNHAFGGPFRVQPHYLQPVAMFHPRKDVMVHVAAAFGLTGVSDDLIRTGVGFEF